MQMLESGQNSNKKSKVLIDSKKQDINTLVRLWQNDKLHGATIWNSNRGFPMHSMPVDGVESKINNVIKTLKLCAECSTDQSTLNIYRSDDKIKTKPLATANSYKNPATKQMYIWQRTIFEALVQAIYFNGVHDEKLGVMPTLDYNVEEDIKKFYNNPQQRESLNSYLVKDSKAQVDTFDTEGDESTDKSTNVNLLIKHHRKVTGRQHRGELSKLNSDCIKESYTHHAKKEHTEDSNAQINRSIYNGIIAAKQSALAQYNGNSSSNNSPNGSFVGSALNDITTQMQYMVDLYDEAQRCKSSKLPLPFYLNYPAPKPSVTLCDTLITCRLSNPQYEFIINLNEALNTENKYQGRRFPTTLNLDLHTGQGKTFLIETIKNAIEGNKNQIVAIDNNANDVTIEDYNRKSNKNDVEKRSSDDVANKKFIMFVDEHAHMEEGVLDAIHQRKIELMKAGAIVAQVNVTATINKQTLKGIAHHDDLIKLEIINKAHAEETKETIRKYKDMWADKVNERERIEKTISDMKVSKTEYTNECVKNIESLIGNPGEPKKRIQYIMPHKRFKDDNAKTNFLTTFSDLKDTVCCILSDNGQKIFTYTGGTSGIVNNDGAFRKLEEDKLLKGKNIVTFFDSSNAVGGDFGSNNNSNIDEVFVHLETKQMTNADLQQCFGRDRSVEAHTGHMGKSNKHFYLKDDPKMTLKGFIEDGVRQAYETTTLKKQRQRDIQRQLEIIKEFDNQQSDKFNNIIGALKYDFTLNNLTEAEQKQEEKLKQQQEKEVEVAPSPFSTNDNQLLDSKDEKPVDGRKEVVQSTVHDAGSWLGRGVATVGGWIGRGAGAVGRGVSTVGVSLYKMYQEARKRKAEALRKERSKPVVAVADDEQEDAEQEDEEMGDVEELGNDIIAQAVKILKAKIMQAKEKAEAERQAKADKEQADKDKAEMERKEMERKEMERKEMERKEKERKEAKKQAEEEKLFKILRALLLDNEFRKMRLNEVLNALNNQTILMTDKMLELRKEFNNSCRSNLSCYVVNKEEKNKRAVDKNNACNVEAILRNIFAQKR